MAAIRRLLTRSRQLGRSQVLLQQRFINSHGIFSNKVISLDYKDITHFPSRQQNCDSSQICWHGITRSFKDQNSGRKFHSSRWYTEELLPYIKSILDVLEGPDHCWFNMHTVNVQPFDENGIFLVIIGAFLDNPRISNRRKQIFMLERVKMLKRRYPNLQIFGFQYCKSISSVRCQTAMTIAEEYVQFPVLLSDKVFPELGCEACYMLFRGCMDHMLKYCPDVEIDVISEEIEQSQLRSDSNSVKEKQNNGMCDLEISKGNSSCSSFKNLLLYFPGCISADEHGNRLFLSDTNHHRIIICDGDGMIIDCIGSSPGYVDGEFESAQLLRPAGSFYHPEEDSLYFVDCENHSIRRAHLGSRVVKTIYPMHSRPTYGIWDWFLNKLGLSRENYPESEENFPDSFAFPWHLMKSGENDLLVLTRSFETSWILSMDSGQIRSATRGFSNIMKTYENIIMSKASALGDLYKNNVLPRSNLDLSLETFPYISSISATAMLNNDILFCDTAAQRVLKCDPRSGKVTNLKFSDLEMLGFPYWIIYPVESVLLRDAYKGHGVDHHQKFNILPGSCNILVNVDVANGFELEGPLREECIWREARGSATEITGMEESVAKVGVAQQWYDELDNLVYSKVNSDACSQFQDVSSHSKPPDDKKVQIRCAVNTSPGTSEVVVIAALYLRPQNTQNDLVGQDLASKLVNLYGSPAGCGGMDLLLETIEDPRGLVFMKPLHLRITLDCADHPTDPVTKEIIPTTTNLEVSVSLS